MSTPAPKISASTASVSNPPPLVLPADLPAPHSAMSLLGVDYIHLKTADGGDLYLTRFGLPFWKNLLPENWYAREWFEAKRERLEGTSTVYKVPTRPVNGKVLHLVVKWSRVGEMVPFDTLTVNKFIQAEFNSPFEEFSLLMELRRGEAGPAAIRIRTQLPLAIYVPSERLQLWQTGRSEDKIRAKITRHPGVEIDILRQYVVLFGWIKGMDAVDTAEKFGLEGRAQAEFLARVTSLVTHELWQKGFRVVDMKPAHIILRPQPDQTLLRDRNDQFAYALVDYELLERTPEHEQAVRSVNRQLYLKHMARRFDTDAANPMPAHLRATNVLGVDYIFGRAESTGGLLWVVGKDPDLFNYFLPERWRRTPKKKLSARNQIFHTRTKDNINLVWKVSRMGDSPWLKNPDAHKEAARAYGFNSPFEEFAFAFEMSRHGVRTVYPRAIYMTGRPRGSARPVSDERRFAALADFLTPDGATGRAQGIRLHHHLGFLERPGRTARGAGRKILSGRQRQTRLHQQADFQTNHGGTDADGHAPAGPLRIGRPQSQTRSPADFLRFGAAPGARHHGQARSAALQFRTHPPPGKVMVAQVGFLHPPST